ncbi:hypothetical protein CPB83DRAFT_933590 [Crepidotus variabilis]|uniref:Uncharacterized protein n=1 Tax=Crepidotus variabilis TaxID=179855 RepID=A0A9P6JPG7_9AGAR|nr:hypothetical protein CPB83DRAFT_933590 [Crepidotus variabilis]
MFSPPSPSASHGDVVLQPNYFTSSIYVLALRDDFSALVLHFHEEFDKLQSSASLKPFALFKTVWLQMGWKWLHFKVFDARSRQAFLDVTLRIFLEGTAKTEAPFIRIVALFALYTFFYTQIKETSPPLHSVLNIPVPYDHYSALVTMHDSLTTTQFHVFEPHVRYVLSRLRQDHVFLVLPYSELGSMNPGTLPRELFAEDGLIFHDPTQKRKGRPAKKDKSKQARLALDELEGMLDQATTETRRDVNEAEYRQLKSALMLSPDGMSTEVLEQASGEVLNRLKEAQALADTSKSTNEAHGVFRVKQAMKDDSEKLGLLGFI